MADWDTELADLANRGLCFAEDWAPKPQGTNVADWSRDLGQISAKYPKTLNPKP